MKRFERSNGLDTVLYKNYLYSFVYLLLGFECSVHVSDGFPKKLIVGGVSTNQFYFRLFVIFFNFARPLKKINGLSPFLSLTCSLCLP